MSLKDDWRKPLAQMMDLSVLDTLFDFLKSRKSEGGIIYPQESDVFAAFNLTEFNKVKVVVLGQDPYHGPQQAHGLSFSVLPSVKIPPSLVNIYKELESDLGIQPVNHGCLIPWAQQGVLLLNSVLTVEAGQPNSHKGKGWEAFTDAVIALINNQHEHVVFILWGAYAQKKGKKIDRNKHLVLESVHPSPLSVYRGFFGCQHFSKTNEYLKYHNQDPIHWQLTEL
ncbi:uracil-DNA glycosylase [Marinomonas sp. 15G1-11]|uniref:Uracil-DNA glycosylase n=2 Tax=Marinomonas phaeophyticola TaxID=3004091 RepID=A0ABT4JRL6_9GAMM|nr:uracil-DNA glycosylase [Marinomonas sp. 15G1-11]MCZ2720821.1 uracil-DNA glycosylase [Marinomonas sp. 15G1-11]